jgi:hypothetical protein
MTKIKTTYYLRDLWSFGGKELWARRGGEFAKLSTARAEAKSLAKGQGKGARVQVVRVRADVVAEAKR